MNSSVNSLLSLREHLILHLGYRFSTLFGKLESFSNNKTIRNELLFLIDKGYHVSRIKDCYLVKGGAIKSGLKLLLRPLSSDLNVLIQVLDDEEYLPLIELINTHNKGNSIKLIIDAGSNIGVTSIFLKGHYPDAKIISIEPDLANMKQQKKNIKLNKFQNSISIVDKALWKNNTDTLNLGNDFRDGRSWAKRVTLGTKNSMTVGAISLEKLIMDYFITDVIDIFKIDIEGSEAELFSDQKFVELLSQKVKFLSLEIHDEFNCRDAIYSALTISGFKLKEVGETTFCYNSNLMHL